MRQTLPYLLAVLVASCVSKAPSGNDHDTDATDSVANDTGTLDSGASDTGVTDSGASDSGAADSGATSSCANPTADTTTLPTLPSCRSGAADPFVDCVVSITIGSKGGYGLPCAPDLLFGPPKAAASGSGGTDVLALGLGGAIVVSFNDEGIVNGEGVDFIVFENPFPGWTEPGEVSVSADGLVWYTWPCDPNAEGQPGCAGVNPVLSGDPTDPAAAGGDGFDLADLPEPPTAVMRYVRIEDRTPQDLGPPTAGFDLDAVAVVNGAPIVAD